MKQKINLRLGLIALVALILTTVGVTKVYYDLFRQQVGRDLRLTAHLLGRSGEFTRGNTPKLQDPEVRITWVDADGTVLYDDEADAGALPNHADRPEIRQAMDTGEGEIVRTSDTFNMNTFYYALRLDDGTVLRLAVDARSISSVFLAAVPVLLSALGANVSGKRTAFVYLLIDVLGVVIWATVFYIANAIAHFDFMTMTMTTVSIALMNTLFRLATVIVLAPLIGVLEKCVCLLIPENPESVREEQEMDRLEERFLLHPALALEQSRQVTDAMAQRAMDNLLRAMDLVHKFSDKGCRAVEDAENAIDRYEDRLGSYLMKITGKELSQRQSEEVSKYLHTISDFERISDHALNICDAAREINAKSVVFSPEAERELRTLEQAITEILHLAVGAFVSGDLEGASRVEPLEEIVDGLCDEMKLHHVDRLQKGVCTLNQGFIFNDLLTNYERVADHCSNIAVAMIELESDSFDTHEYLNSVKAMKSASFARYSAEYQKKYTL